MPTMQSESTPRRADAPFIWERQARPVMDAIAVAGRRPARAVVVGNAGSGKSTMLRELHRLLADHTRRREPAGRLRGRRAHSAGRTCCWSTTSTSSTPRRSSSCVPVPRTRTPRSWSRAGRGRASEALTAHRPEPGAEPAGDRARARLAVGRADVSERRRPGHLELVRGSHPGIHRRRLMARLRGACSARRARLRRRQRAPRCHPRHRGADRPPARHDPRAAAPRDRGAVRGRRCERPARSPRRTT